MKCGSQGRSLVVASSAMPNTGKIVAVAVVIAIIVLIVVPFRLCLFFNLC